MINLNVWYRYTIRHRTDTDFCAHFAARKQIKRETAIFCRRVIIIPATFGSQEQVILTS